MDSQVKRVAAQWSGNACHRLIVRDERCGPHLDGLQGLNEERSERVHLIDMD